jgi:ribonuclease D
VCVDHVRVSFVTVVIDQQDPDEVEQETSDAPVVPVLTEPRDGVPPVIETQTDLVHAAQLLADGSGPLAIDAERASGYRYGQRAYLIQVRREGSGTHLIDPIAVTDLRPLAAAFTDTEWVLHAASQDLPCLREVGLNPTSVFETELAARLLGYPRVGLSGLLEDILGVSLAKEHSAADWSTRPLPEPWLRYAALDVELLLELRDVIEAELRKAGKYDLAIEEFDAIRDAPPAAPRVDPWRRTSGLHKIRKPRQLAAVKAMWEARDEVAQKRDVSPGRVLPDSAMIAAATAFTEPTPPDLSTLPAFGGRGARRHIAQWQLALANSANLPEADLPPTKVPAIGPPPARSWPDKDPAAASRLAVAKEGLTHLSQEQSIPIENLVTPDLVRRILWSPPFEPGQLAPHEQRQVVEEALREGGARAWQINLVADAIMCALNHVPDLSLSES